MTSMQFTHIQVGLCLLLLSVITDPAWAQINPQRAQTRILAESVRLCRDCVELRREITLGEEDDHGFLTPQGSVVRDRLGRYWAMQTDGVKVYGPDGTFLREVGRAGEGPLEFRMVSTALVGEDGDVHVYDMGNLRETIVGEDFTLQAVHQLPGVVLAIAPLSGGTRYVVNMDTYSPRGVGFPLHLVEASNWRIVESFAPTDASTRSAQIPRFPLSVGSDGRILTSFFDVYRFDLWSADGSVHLASLERRGIWEPAAAARRASSEVEVRGRVVAVRLDHEGLVWVASWVPRHDWRDNLVENRPGFATASWYAPTDVWTSLVEVIDPSSATVVASVDLGADLIEGFLDDRTVYGPLHGPDGSYRVQVSTLHFNRP